MALASPDGEVPERPKGHASKACDVQASVGSNPTFSATRAEPVGFGSSRVLLRLVQ